MSKTPDGQVALVARRQIPLTPKTKVERGQTFTVSDELAAKYLDRGDACRATEDANPVRPTKPANPVRATERGGKASQAGKAKPSSSSRPARPPKPQASPTPVESPTS